MFIVEVWADLIFSDFGCPPNWKPYQDRCYRTIWPYEFKIPNVYDNYSNPNYFCREMVNAELASVTNIGINNFIIKLAERMHPFYGITIGLMQCSWDPENVWCNMKRENWTWMVGSELNFTNWNSGEPNNYLKKETCAEIVLGLRPFNNLQIGYWNDIHCGKKLSCL